MLTPEEAIRRNCVRIQDDLEDPVLHTQRLRGRLVRLVYSHRPHSRRDDLLRRETAPCAKAS